MFDAMDERRFYIYSHPKALAGVQTRMEDLMLARNPTDPFTERPEIGAKLRADLRAADTTAAQQPSVDAPAAAAPPPASVTTKATRRG